MRAAGFVVVVALGACTNFDYIPADQCGNGVLEAGEDCDLVAGAPLADTCVACRYVCDETFRSGCPEGWGCGADLVCRHAIGDYVESTPAIDVAVTDFVIANLDDDPFPDALGYGPTEIWLARGTPGPGFVVVDRHPRTRGDVAPALGDLQGGFVSFLEPPTPDLVMSIGTRAVAMFDTTGGRLSPAPQTWCELGAEAHVATVARPPSSAPVLVSYDMLLEGMSVARPGGPMSASLPLPTPGPCSADLLQLVAADLDADGDDELVLGCGGSSTLQVVDLVVDGGGAPQLEVLATLDLGDPLEGPIVIADLDGDDRLDIAGTVLPKGAVPDVAVVRQTAPLGFTTVIRDGRLDGATLLAAGDLDADGALDLVSSAGIELRRGADFERAASSPSPWTRATIADVDGDGVLDVAGLAAGELDTMRAVTPGTYAPRIALGVGVGRDLRAGDLDGDGLTDLVTWWDVGNDAVVRILYGGTVTPIEAGAIAETITGFVIADLVVDATVLAADAASEIVTVTGQAVTVFVGGATRPPLAPLDTLVDPRVLALGRFDVFSQDSSVGDDLVVLGGPGDPAMVAYGSTSTRRQLADRHLLAGAIDDCVEVPAIVAVGPLVDGIDSVVELTCTTTTGGLVARRWALAGARDTPDLQSSSWSVGTFVDPIGIAIAELDDDLAPEVITITDETLVPVRVFPNAGNGPSPVDVLEFGELGDRAITTGNVDDDPATELVVGGDVVLAYDYTADAVTPVLPPGLDHVWLVDAPGIPRLFDLDRDGVQDLIVGGDTLRVFRAIPHTD